MEITNAQHAAVIFKCLPRATADQFLAKLDPESCALVVGLMDRTEVTTEKLVAAIALLERSGLGAAEPHARINLDRAVAEGRHHQYPRRQKSPFEFLKQYDTSFLLQLIGQEQSRHAATILSTLPKEVVSAILKEVDALKRVEIIRHIAALSTLGGPDNVEIMELKFALQLRIQKMLKETDGAPTSDQEAPVARSVSKTLPTDQLNKLANMPDNQIKQLLRRIDTSHLAPALKTCPINVQKKVLRNMANKPAAILSKEIIEVRIDEKHRIERSSRSIAHAIKQLEKK